MHVVLPLRHSASCVGSKVRQILVCTIAGHLRPANIQHVRPEPSRRVQVADLASSASAISVGGSRLCRRATVTLLSKRKRPRRATRTVLASEAWMAGTIAALGSLAAWLLGVRSKVATLQIGGSAFQQKVLEQCRTILSPYTTYPLLNNGHFETIFAARFRNTPYVTYNRTTLDMPDGGKVTLDQERLNPAQDLPHDAPVVILLPGLTGGSEDSYVQVIASSPISWLQHMVVASRAKGLRAVVFNGRGTSKSPITVPQFYSASFTGDMKAVVEFVQKEYPGSLLLAVGWSLGANILVTYLGEEKCSTPLVAAASLCNPFDLAVADENFHVGFNRIYDWSLANGLRRIFGEHKTLFYNTGRPFNPDKAANCNSIREFDDAVTRVCFGFPNVDAYYEAAGSAKHVPEVAVPLLCIQADNDPIAPAKCIPYKALRANPNCTLVVTPGGGHLGWVSGPGAFFGAPWTNDAVAEWLSSAVQLLQKDSKKLEGVQQNGIGH